jgi:predicted TIM-barrel fold metal-dependent hydrolase
VCDTARAFRLPILVDVAGHAHVVDMVAPQYPEVNFIIPHLGSFSDDWRAQQQVALQVGRYPNVYADTAGVRRFDYIVEALKRGGSRKVLFGSDGPWLHPGVELHKIRVLGLSPEHEARVLGENLLSLIGNVHFGARGIVSGPKSRMRENRNTRYAAPDPLSPGAETEYQL